MGDNRCSIFVIDSAGKRRPFRQNTFIDHVTALGASRREARAIAQAIPPEVVAERGEEGGIRTSELRRIGQDVAALGILASGVRHYLAEPVREPVADVRRDPIRTEPTRAPIRKGRRSIFERVFAPLHGSATVVRELDPVLARFTDSSTLLVRSLCESTVRSQIGRVLEAFEGTGLDQAARLAIRERILHSPLPYSSEFLLGRVKQDFKELQALGLGADEERSIRTRRMADLVHQLEGAASGETRVRDWDEDTPVDKLPEKFRPRPLEGSPFGETLPDSEYLVEGALEFPSMSGDIFDFSLTGYESVWRLALGADDIEGTEFTYLNDAVRGVKKDNHVASSDGSQVVHRANHYRPVKGSETIEHVNVSGFFDQGVPNTSLIRTMTFALVEKNQTPGIGLLVDLVEENDEDIKKAIEDVADTAGAAVDGFFASNGLGQLSSGAGSLAKSGVKAALQVVYEFIVDLIGTTHFPLWTIIHYYEHLPPAAPLSVFAAETSADQRTLLHQVDASDPMASINTDYDSFPGIKREYRWMVGHSQELRTTAPPEGAPPTPRNPASEIPRLLWRRVYEENAPAVWAKAEAREGFRIVVPLKAEGGDGFYVLSLRADVVARPR